MLNLKPSEFGDMQPYTFLKLIEGYNVRQTRRDQYCSFFASLMINYTKTVKINRKIEPDEIFKVLQGKPKRNIREDRAYLKETFKQRLKEVSNKNENS